MQGMKTYTKIKGLTLLELLIVISIVSILAFVAVPAMDSTMKTNSVRSLQRTFLSAFAYARGEAVARNKLISICPSTDESTCSDDPLDWSAGWIVFEDTEANGELDPSDTLLRTSKYTGSSTVAVFDTDSQNLQSLTWNYRGYVEEGGENIPRAFVVVCPKDNDEFYARGFSMGRTGRAILTRDAEGNDGIHEITYETDANLGDGTPNVVTEQLSCG